ncbi:MAG TPA: methyltransferase domain-containing protein [Mucilaginibacter sp.]|nr:methyltransferase domain-containing protein [Mucilaginibacter sp.]
MKPPEAITLIQKAITGNQPQRWADLGSGNGTFSIALNSILPTGSHITAIDKQAQKLPVDFLQADFEKDDLNLTGLDGILLANSLHYIRDTTKLIKKLEAYFTSVPTFLIVEYDTTRSNAWVPYPINYQNLQQLFASLGYSAITKLAEAPSRFGGSLYSALIRL